MGALQEMIEDALDGVGETIPMLQAVKVRKRMQSGAASTALVAVAVAVASLRAVGCYAGDSKQAGRDIQ